MTTITLYGKDLSFCGGCKATKRMFEQYGIPYEYVAIDLPENADLLELWKLRGFTAAPIVSVMSSGREVDVWSGFRPDKISALKEAA